MNIWVKLALGLLLVGQGVQAQEFLNLDFERAVITNLIGDNIPATNAFPDWTVDAPIVAHDDFSLSGGSISILDTNPPASFAQIQGRYYAFLASANDVGFGIPISIGQTGTVPSSANSIIFWGMIGGMQVTFDNQALAFDVVGSTANYDIYQADISEFAGQTGQLLFTLPPYVENGILDNIQFSPLPVPEPGVLGLSAVGGLFLVWRRGRKYFQI